MTTRDQAEAGDDDPAKTVRLDDTYRVRVARGEETGNRQRAARSRLRVPRPSKETLPLDDQLGHAESALDSALAEFRSAAAAVIDRIKAGEDLPKLELDREWNARLQLIEARQLVERLGHLRKALAPPNVSPADRSRRPPLPRVVPASESATGGIDHDERGHARWKWKADVAASADSNAETFDYLKALDANLQIEQSQKVRVLEESTKTGMNPYDTARSKKVK